MESVLVAPQVDEKGLYYRSHGQLLCATRYT